MASVARDAKAAIQGRVSFSEAANLAWQGVATVARDAKDSYSKEAERLEGRGKRKRHARFWRE